MEVLKIFFNVLAFSVFIYMGMAVVYVFVFAVAGLFRRKQITIAGTFKRMAIMVPAYKEDEVILDVAFQATQQNYPRDHFDVIIIADSLQEKTLDALKTLPVKLIQVSFEKSTKSKALNMAMSQMERDYDIALVLDADNIMEPDFLVKVNAAFTRGVKVVQGKRVAKNLNTSFAILDGISEAVNNHIFRQGHRALGLSSGLIGSAMAFDYKLFSAVMKEIHAVGGFDKELEFRLFENGHKIEYLNDAVVYDEKIQSPGDFNNQRRRWLSTNQVYLKRFFRSGSKAFMVRGNMDMIDKLYQMILPPRVLLLGAVFLLSFAHLVIDLFWQDLSWPIPPYYWYVLTLLTTISFLVSIPKDYYTLKTLRACLSVPRAFFIMFLLLFRLKGANKEFIHTKHHSALNS